MVDESEDSLDLTGHYSAEEDHDVRIAMAVGEAGPKQNGNNNLYPTTMNGVAAEVTPVINGFGSNTVGDEPYLEIVEEPQSRGFRFRYKCEGGSHGGLQGENSEKGKKTYPTVRINNWTGAARIVVSLVTDEEVPKTHAHELVGKNCQNGICLVELKGGSNNTATFPNMGVQHITRRNLVNVLSERIQESIRLNHVLVTGNPNAGLTEAEKNQAKEQAEEQAKGMHLSTVRLCFQAYLMDENGTYSRMLPSVISKQIYDCKAPGAAALKICRLDRQAGSVRGNDEVFLLCDKVQKDDIAVRFFEEDEDGRLKWEAYGNFGPPDVHRQYAIVFRTPPYWNVNIAKAVVVRMQLMRRSDRAISDPKPFTYFPEVADMDEISKKRKKTVGFPFSRYGGSGGSSGGYSSGGSGGGGSGLVGPAGGTGAGGSATYNFAGTSQGVNRPVNPPMMKGSGYVQQPSLSTQPISNLNGNMSRANQHPIKMQNIGGSMAAPSFPHYGPTDSEDLVTDSAPDFDDMNMFSPPYDSSSNQPYYGYPQKGLLARGTISVGKENNWKSDMENITSKTKQMGLDEVPIPTKGTSAPEPQPDSLSQQNNDLVMRLAARTAEALQDYAATGDTKALLAVQRHLVGVQDEAGDNCVHIAVIHKRVEACKNLLSVAVTIPNSNIVNQLNKRRQTPLHLAVLTQQPLVVDLLLKSGADPYIVDLHGNTATHLAAELGSKGCLEVLLKYMRLNTSPSNPFPELAMYNYEGFAPVHLAALCGSLQALKVILRVQTDVNIQDGKSGRTALHHAVEKEDLALVGCLLLEAGADVNATTYDGNTALHLACGRECTGMVALLMAAGADPNIENSELLEEEKDDEGDGVDEEEKKKNDPEEDLIGHTAFDLAWRNAKIQKILNGEPYSTFRDVEDHSAHLIKSGGKVYTLSQDSGLGSSSVTGDLDKLDYMSRVSLAKLLDPCKTDQDWEAVAKYLDLGHLVSTFRPQKSPTLSLLDNYEVLDGTISQLTQCLKELGRTDAIAIIEELQELASEVKKTGIHSSVKQLIPPRRGQEPEKCDSGVESFFTPDDTRQEIVTH
ncbi:nuclear factor NF-kappa-B p105 subunit isoform X1 [Lingula anatina]|uniref:Nuclear factor NF-kappa-B p105 subunit isoform X1 n=1 Tax=Lingula anatina TaxID=7574 RepID=A0A1S3J667_LINAN|nr:nuclear factor NF-kappa-B p105 subunit isoform X1 [Lingula anatina]|eukprot:XP_013405334.1 nuclear factor NF-kappa-B p105 subunit isoform X1 [Lingula anatina]